MSFATALRAPLLFDAYSHVANASRECFAEVMGAFYKHPLKGDFFFRPVGILSYWMDFQWARFDPFEGFKVNFEIEFDEQNHQMALEVEIENILDTVKIKDVVLDCSSMNLVDTMGVDALAKVNREYGEIG